MKKKIICLLLAVVVILTTICFAGCNMSVIDTTYSFDKAMIYMPDGTVVKGRVESWKDYEDSDAIQVEIDGKVYYTFLNNVVLIKE